jgi:predicted alpha/beta-hydrolase family hydrolase
MKTLILPGFSVKNKEWAQDLAKKLDLGHEVEVVFWRHWQKGGSLALNYEMEKIKNKIGDDEVNLIAKSVGSRVTVNLIPLLKGRIEKVVFCGIPFRGFGDETKTKFRKALASFPTKNIICFQNERDPFGNYQTVAEFIHSINPKISVIRMPRSDHHYPYPTEFQRFFRSGD